MSGTISETSETSLTPGAAPAVTDDAALAEAFQTALIQGAVFMLSSLTSDATEAVQDNSSDPDAPF